MNDRETAIARFLGQTGWVTAHRTRIAGDASQRRYERLARSDMSAILMDAPIGQGDNPADFQRIDLHLRKIGLKAPEILAADLTQGLMLLEDFGDASFAKVMALDPLREGPLCEMATDVILHAQSQPAPSGLPDLTADDWAKAAMVSLDWYRFAITDDEADARPFQRLLGEVLAKHADGPRVLILRDYHAENLMWVAGRSGLDQVGLLDFQLAQMGQPGYDLVSLLQDARRDVATATEAACIARFCAATGADPAAFRQSYAVLGIQRALRILGMFARLCLVDGKVQYLAHLPRVWGQLQRNLAQSGLEPLADLCNSLLPAPDAPNLEKIACKCAKITPH
jgi:N-acetylmuramate 1-kinase